MPNDTTKAAPDERAELKPCPFCGGNNLKSGGDDKIVGTWCLDCQCHGPNHYVTGQDWNTRTPPQVKALVWEKLQNGDYRAAAPLFGSVRIECYAADEFVVLWSVPGFCDTVVAGTFLTANDAKAAFHTQYTRRILETLA